ncbi:hypothetical protein HN873_016214, partial [Arachis hypogaea]
VIGARLMCVDRTEELKRSRAVFDKAAMDQLMQENVEKSGKLRDALDLVDQLGEKLGALETSLKKSLEDRASLETRLVVLGVEKKQAEDEKENHGLEMFVAGFEKAVEQVKFLVPDADLSRMDPCKVTVRGELVEDDDDVEGEGENPDSPARVCLVIIFLWIVRLGYYFIACECFMLFGLNYSKENCGVVSVVWVCGRLACACSEL